MLRVFLATFAGAGTAVVVVAIIAMLAWPLAGGRDSPFSIAVHFIVFGAFVSFPLAFLGGIPLYFFFKWRGWLTPRSVLVGGVALSLIFPLQTWLINQSGGFESGFLVRKGRKGRKEGKEGKEGKERPEEMVAQRPCSESNTWVAWLSFAFLASFAEKVISFSNLRQVW